MGRKRKRKAARKKENKVEGEGERERVRETNCKEEEKGGMKLVVERQTSQNQDQSRSPMKREGGS